MAYVHNFKGIPVMKLFVKATVAGACVLGAASANALGVPALNNSDLILIVVDESTSNDLTYALDTNISINSVLGSSAGTYVSGATLNNTAFAGINESIAASSTLTNFLGGTGGLGTKSTDTFGWEVEAGQYNGGSATTTSNNSNSKPAGAAIGIFSSAGGTATPSNVEVGLSKLESYLTGLNGDVTNAAALGSLTGTETATATTSTGAMTKYGFFGANDLEAVGNTDTLFGLTGNGNTGAVQTYVLGTAKLTSSGLTFVGNTSSPPPPVPLPAAVWLLASGLLGLVGVSRGRKAAV
jgi:hypothetical protein